MMSTNKGMHEAETASASEDQRDYRLIFMVAFALCLLACVAGRLLARPLWASDGSQRPKGSVLEQAKSQASLAASAALMR